MERRAASARAAAIRRERGVLFGSGLVGGEGLMGVAIAAVAFYTKGSPPGFGADWPARLAVALGIPDGMANILPGLLATVVFGLLALGFAWFAREQEGG
jgi:hypothetical protein